MVVPKRNLSWIDHDKLIRERLKDYKLQPDTWGVDTDLEDTISLDQYIDNLLAQWKEDK